MAAEGKAGRAKAGAASKPAPADVAAMVAPASDMNVQTLEYQRMANELEQVQAKLEKAQKIIGRMKTQTGDDRALIAEHEETIDEVTKKLQIVSRAYQDLQLQEQTRRQVEADNARRASESNKTKENA